MNRPTDRVNLLERKVSRVQTPQIPSLRINLRRCEQREHACTSTCAILRYILQLRTDL